MARKLKKSKVSICVFCEGESEQAYTDFLKSKFQDLAVFKRPSSTGLFDDADNRFKKDPKYRDYADVIDEISTSSCRSISSTRALKLGVQSL